MGTSFKAGKYVVIGVFSDLYSVLEVNTMQELCDEVEKFIRDEMMQDEDLDGLRIYRVLADDIKIRSKIEVN